MPPIHHLRSQWQNKKGRMTERVTARETLKEAKTKIDLIQEERSKREEMWSDARVWQRGNKFYVSLVALCTVCRWFDQSWFAGPLGERFQSWNTRCQRCRNLIVDPCLLLSRCFPPHFSDASQVTGVRKLAEQQRKREKPNDVFLHSLKQSCCLNMMDGWVLWGYTLVYLVNDTEAAMFCVLFLRLSFHLKCPHHFGWKLNWRVKV